MFWFPLFSSLLSSPLLFLFHVNKPRIRALPWSVGLSFLLFSFFFFKKKEKLLLPLFKMARGAGAAGAGRGGRGGRGRGVRVRTYPSLTWVSKHPALSHFALALGALGGLCLLDPRSPG